MIIKTKHKTSTGNAMNANAPHAYIVTMTDIIKDAPPITAPTLFAISVHVVGEPGCMGVF